MTQGVPRFRQTVTGLPENVVLNADGGMRYFIVEKGNIMEIRHLTPDDDLLQVSSVYEQSWKHAYKGFIPQTYLDSIPAGRWAASVSKPDMNNLVLEDNGVIVGTSCYCASRWEKFAEYGEIVSVYLLPEYTGKGYGRKLVERAVSELNLSGFEKVLLWVLEENTNARRFYEHLGFKNSGEVLNDNIGGKDLREIMYTRTAY